MAWYPLPYSLTVVDVFFNCWFVCGDPSCCSKFGVTQDEETAWKETSIAVREFPDNIQEGDFCLNCDFHWKIVLNHVNNPRLDLSVGISFRS